MITFTLEFDSIEAVINFLRRIGAPPDVPAATLADLNALENRIMSALSDAVAEVTAELNAAKTRIEQKIADLQAQIDAGGAPPEVIAELNADRDLLKTLPTSPAPPV